MERPKRRSTFPSFRIPSKKSKADELAKLNPMKWLKRKSKTSSSSSSKAQAESRFPYGSPLDDGTPPVSRELLAKLPQAIFERIFSYVCPHSGDETYDSIEHSNTATACCLCDARDLAHCALVSRKWRFIATRMLYHSIRIDVLHYCQREEYLAEKRKVKGFSKNHIPEDVPQARLRLLSRTVRDGQQGLAPLVKYFKLPYMTRETNKPDLARTVAVLPNLRYVDLPEGVFKDDPSCETLKQEIQARCPDLRKMSYWGGGERSLELLSNGLVWRNLEVLELSRLNMDTTILRHALGSLPQLRALKVTNMERFDDDMFHHSDHLPPFPALNELVFENTPNLKAEGLVAYLFRSDAQDALKTLSLTTTGVHPSTLHEILACAPHLEKLTIIETVSTSFTSYPAKSNVPALQSKSLEVLHYEISAGELAPSYASATGSYYTYLTSCILSRGLPNLKELYVRDPDFPETLIDLAPPSAAFMNDPDNFTPPQSGNPFLSPAQNTNRFSSNNPFAKLPASPSTLSQPLQVYSKGLDEMEWNFSSVEPPKSGRRGSVSAARPVSSYGLSDDSEKAWRSGARRSVIVGNGFGGFLAIPAGEDGRPSSSAGEKKRRGSQYDMWR